MLLSVMDPIYTEWIRFFIPLISGDINILILSTLLWLMRKAYNTLCTLTDHILGI